MEAFPGMTGRGVRVAVIDSGVSPLHPHINGVAGGISIGPAGLNPDYQDLVGHGTAVMAAIKQKAPDAEYFAVRVFYKALRTNLECLLAAIEWCVEERMDLVNLSLGTLNTAHLQKFEAAIDIAAAQGVTLISPREVDGVAALPGSLPGLIGAGLNWALPRDSYECSLKSGAPEFFASGYPRPVPGVPVEHNLQGVSFASANLCGFAALACQSLRNRSYLAVQESLAQEAERIRG